jgi:hypothetical protein
MKNICWLQIVDFSKIIIHKRTCPIVPLTYPDEKFNRQVQGGTWLQFDNEEEAIQFYEEGYASLFPLDCCPNCQQR